VKNYLLRATLTLPGLVWAQDIGGKVSDLQSKVLDLVFNVQDMGGNVQSLDIKETPTELRIDLAAEVLFDFDKADILPKAQQTLTQAAQIIRDRAKGEVRIYGYTDAKGSDPYNQKLSERRAEAVKAWFIKDAKIQNVKFVTEGFGAKNPVAPNANPPMVPTTPMAARRTAESKSSFVSNQRREIFHRSQQHAGPSKNGAAGNHAAPWPRACPPDSGARKFKNYEEEVVELFVARVNDFSDSLLSESPAALDFSISMEPLKYAPSSIMIRAVVRSPTTEPSFLISIRSRACKFPFTFPYTTTSRAITSAVTFALAPITSLRSSR